MKALGPRSIGLVMVALVGGCGPADVPSSFTKTSPTGQTLFTVGLKQGKPDGEARTFHSNGEKSSEGAYIAGKRHGLFQFWDDRGQWLRQEFYIFGNLGWASTDFFALPPKDVELIDEIAAKQLAGKQTAKDPMQAWIDTYVPPPPRTRFINGLESQGTYAQVTLGSGSSQSDSSAQRVHAFGSMRRGRVGGSLTLVVARFSDSDNSSWAKPIAHARVSYLLPHSTGQFVVRAGAVLPLGNDSNSGALTGAASVQQSPNEASYVMPSTLVPTGSISWFSGSEYIRTQIDLGLDLGIFGYSQVVHPVVHANGAVGVGILGFLVGGEVSTAISFSDTMGNMALAGGALYGRLQETTVGLFAGSGDNSNVLRVRVARDF